MNLYETELIRLAGFLQPCSHHIAFIGSIGVASPPLSASWQAC